MATVVRMPSVMANQQQGSVASWLTAEGRTITSGAPLAEIETEKAVVELAAEIDGVVGRLLIEPGAMVAVGTPIAVVLGEGDADVDRAVAAALEEAGVAVGPGGDDAAAAPAPPPADPDPAVTAAAPSVPAVDHSADPGSTGAANGSGTGRVFSSPIVRQLAREHDVDLHQIVGTGPGGRVVRRDLQAWLRERPAGPAPTVPARPTPPAPPAPAPNDRSPQPAAAADDGAFTDLPLSGMRRAIARRLTESTTTVPHFFLRADCRMDRLLALRADLNAGADASQRLSVNDFVVKAVAGALVEAPAANTLWTGEHLRRLHGVDIAVAVDVPDGLLTPVIRDAHRISIGELSSTIRRLADRARRGELRQDDLEGGSFAVSNLGMRGVTEFAAIINPPQAGILAVGAATRRPVVDPDGVLGVATVMTVTLSADHRVLDGAAAAEWLGAFQRQIEDPLQLLR